jgi:hypothetical protein
VVAGSVGVSALAGVITGEAWKGRHVSRF